MPDCPPARVMAKGAHPDKKQSHSMMNETETYNANGVNGSDLAELSSPSPGRLLVENQARTGRQPITGRRISWNRQQNINVMKCYYASRNPRVRGYMSRMQDLWLRQGGADVSAQRLTDQARNIRVKQWLSEAELEEIEKEVVEGSAAERTEEQSIAQPENEREHIENDTTVVNLQNQTEEVEQNGERRSELGQTIIAEVRRIAECDDRPRLLPLKHIAKSRLRKEVAVINRVLDGWKVHDITELNNTLYVCAKLVTERLVNQSNRQSGEPWWKKRLKSKVQIIQKDLSKVVEAEKKNHDDRTRVAIERRFNIMKRGYASTIEDLKQKLKAVAAKIRRYEAREKQYRQNKLFTHDQKRLYQELDGCGAGDDRKPDAVDTKAFWEDIWSQRTEHDANSRWFKKVTNEMRERPQQGEVTITLEAVTNAIKNAPNWKAPGPDGLQGYWLKAFTPLHQEMRRHLQFCLEDAVVPQWMTTGRTTLVMKDPRKGPVPSNYRPITCLPILWKLLTSVLAEEMYDHLEANDLIGMEQMGCRRGKRGTKEHLMMDKAILNHAKLRKKNLAVAWIDYQKAYDLVPHSWILETMKLTGCAKNATKLIGESMKQWQTRLQCQGEHLAEVKFKRGIFQGDTLSPLLFVLALIPLSVLLRGTRPGYQLSANAKVNHMLFMDDLKLFASTKAQLESLVGTVRIFTEATGMRFGLNKCASMVMKKGRKVEDEGITLPGSGRIDDVTEPGYKYLGVIESENVRSKEMKEKVGNEYRRRVRKVCESKLNGHNKIMAINTWAVSLLRYSAGIVDWNVDELKDLDRKTRKTLNMNRMLHPKANVARLYISREEGGRGLMEAEECVRREEHALSDYIKTQHEGNHCFDGFLKDRTQSEYKKEVAASRMKQWKEKPLHGQFPSLINAEQGDSWRWLKKAYLKSETEGLLVAAQDQVLPTRWRKATVEKVIANPMCRVCGEKPETIMHILSECKCLAQREYKKRHDRIASEVHWYLCKENGLEHAEKSYDHRAEEVIEDENIKILWDRNIFTDKVIEARRPDIVIVKKNEQRCLVVDVAVPGDPRTSNKETEKVQKYQDLAIELRRLWKMPVEVVPIVIGALGTLNSLKVQLARLGLTGNQADRIQSTALLGSAHILWKILSMPEI